MAEGDSEENRPASFDLQMKRKSAVPPVAAGGADEASASIAPLNPAAEEESAPAR